MSTEIVKAGGSLAIRPDQTVWSPEQEAVLRQSGINDSVTAPELSGFLHLCQRTKLDPFSRQIYLIGRWNKKAGREVFTAQTAIDGYRVIAHRAATEAACALGYEDTLWCDASGTWRDVWLEDKPPAASKVTVLRNGQRFSAVARYSEYVQTYPSGDPSGLWAKMPAGQTAKCAEALALRKAFPHDLAGVYTAEEMAQADNAAAPHLRSVPACEQDPWATPSAPAAEAPAANTEQQVNEAQANADEAASTKDRDRFRQLWALAKTGRLMDVPVTAPDTKETGPLGHYLTRRAKNFAEQPATTAARVVTGEVMSAKEQAEAAEAELRAFAEQVGLSTIEADFEGAKGAPLAQATAEQIRGFLGELRGSAA